MADRERKYSREELARRGKEWYQQVLPKVESGNHGKIVAIDVDTGEHEVGDSPVNACHQLLERVPEAQMWIERIGFPAVFKLGARFLQQPT